MGEHNFSFDGGSILNKMGASWFVSYAYYEKIDVNHQNWNNVSTARMRTARYRESRSYHKAWLKEILRMNPQRLAKNTIDLSAGQILKMAEELLED